MSVGRSISLCLFTLTVAAATTGCDPYGNTFGCGRRAVAVESDTSMTSAGLSVASATDLATGTFTLDVVWERDPVWTDDGTRRNFEFDEAEGLHTDGSVVAAELTIEADEGSSPQLYESYVDDDDGRDNPRSAYNCRNTPDYIEVPAEGDLLIDGAPVFDGAANARLWNQADGSLLLDHAAVELDALEIPWSADAPPSTDNVELHRIEWRFTVDGWEGDLYASLACPNDDCSETGVRDLEARIARIVPRRP